MGCDLHGNLNEAKFSEPMPWIGLYVVAASLTCAIAMALDLINGFRYQKLWFPSKYFSLNATSLTIVPVAIKFSVDLNTPMPSGLDQLSKLSSAALFCTIIGNSMPSIGTMNNSEIFTNVIALVILVITVAVNICIQLGTGIIYVYRVEHIFLVFLMLYLLLMLSFSALIVPTTKNYLEIKFKKKHEVAWKENCNLLEMGKEKSISERLKQDLMKFWMMAHTSSPQFVMGRSATCTASGALTLLGALTLAETIARYYLLPSSFNFCSGKSDYKWSTTLVLFSQTVAVGVGTIAPAIRWFTAINFRCPKRTKTIRSRKEMFAVEKYWIHRLVEIKDSPLSIRINNRHCRKFAHDVKNRFMDMCMGIQTGIVLISKLIQYISIYFISRILLFTDCCIEIKRKLKPDNSISSESRDGSSRQDLCRFVLHLEGESELVELMMKSNCDATDHWIEQGKKKKSKQLINLLNTASFEKGLKIFITDLVPSLENEEYPNCWALLIVTLTSIAISLPDIDRCLTKQLIQGVHDGLLFLNLIEDHLDEKKKLLNMRRAANSVWQGVDLYHKWLDIDLHKLSDQVKSPKEVLEGLSSAAKKRYTEFKSANVSLCVNKSASNWPIRLLAADYMYRISETILLSSKSSNNMSAMRLFEVLCATISDILGACLGNLPQIVSMKCLCSTIEDREASIRHAAFLLGQTEEVLKILQKRGAVNLNPDNKMTSIDEWCSLEETDSSISNDLYVTIE